VITPSRLRSKLLTTTALILVVLCAAECSLIQHRGWTWHLVLAVDARGAESDATVKRTIEVIKNRLNAFGVLQYEVFPATNGNALIRINLTAVPDRDRLKNFISQMALLEIRPVVSPPSPAPFPIFSSKDEAAKSSNDSQNEIVPYGPGQNSLPAFIVLEKQAIVSGDDLRQATPMPRLGFKDDYQIGFSLKESGADRFKNWTRSHINSYLAVVLDRTALTVAFVKGEISDQGIISGHYSKTAAEDLAMALTAGSLPVPIRIVEEGPN